MPHEGDKMLAIGLGVWCGIAAAATVYSIAFRKVENQVEARLDLVILAINVVGMIVAFK